MRQESVFCFCELEKSLKLVKLEEKKIKTLENEIAHLKNLNNKKLNKTLCRKNNENF